MGKSMNSNNIEDYGYVRNNPPPRQSAFFYNTYARQQTPSSSKADSNSSLPAYQYAKNLQEKISRQQASSIQAANAMRASSLGFDLNANRKLMDKNQAQALYPGLYFSNQQQAGASTPNSNNREHQQAQAQFQQRSSSHFNHFNRASYKGECKRLMSRTNIETVAERAARFEDIDFERYNRLKAKYGELDLDQQYENDFENQLQLQRYLRLNSFGGGEAKTAGIPANLNDYKQFEFARIRSDQGSSTTGTYSPLNSVNSASQVVDALVNDYLTKGRSQSNNHELAWKHESNKFYPGMWFCLFFEIAASK